MDGSDGIRLETISKLADIDRAAWDSVANPAGERFDPFVSWDFLSALESAGCVAGRTGWAPAHLLARDGGGALLGAMPLYFKAHSQGEYVFDHSWADALERAGGRYYPKVQCAVPFTPAPGRRLLTAPGPQAAFIRRTLLSGAVQLAQNEASSLHITFASKAEADELGELGLLRRTGVQFHWANAGYACFDDFLAALSSAKRRAIRKERARAQQGLSIRTLTGSEIGSREWTAFFACYMDTGSRKWGHPYLNRTFFTRIGETMGERIVLFLAEADGHPIAAALNLLGSDTLYGRYWGRLEDRPFLHFELCYYRAIELAIERKLSFVEAGAQGEHKLTRGYAPVATHSLHWIKHPGLQAAVKHFLEAETPAMADEIEFLAGHTPFKRLEC